jgi:hypothetical protein
MRRTHYTPTQRRRLARHAYEGACLISISGHCWLCCANLNDALKNSGWRPHEACPRCGQWPSPRAVELLEGEQGQTQEVAA